MYKWFAIISEKKGYLGMKKAKSGAGSPAKITFGKRREGKHSKSRKPKGGKAKKYIGQGR
jgi:hypothetical protein